MFPSNQDQRFEMRLERP